MSHKRSRNAAMRAFALRPPPSLSQCLDMLGNIVIKEATSWVEPAVAATETAENRRKRYIAPMAIVPKQTQVKVEALG